MKQQELFNPSQTGTGINTIPVTNHYPYNYPNIQNSWWPNTIVHNYTVTPWISIDKAENSFILKKEGKTYVCKTEQDIVELLKENK